MHRLFLLCSCKGAFPEEEPILFFAGSVEPIRVHHQRWWVYEQLIFSWDIVPAPDGTPIHFVECIWWFYEQGYWQNAGGASSNTHGAIGIIGYGPDVDLDTYEEWFYWRPPPCNCEGQYAQLIEKCGSESNIIGWNNDSCSGDCKSLEKNIGPPQGDC